MVVKGIRLQNFMGFPDTGWIELRPITLLFGRNSSGKSSIIRALLLLRQSLETPDGVGPLAFAAHNGADLGSFDRMVHRLENYDRPPDERNREDDDPGKLKQMTFGFRCNVPLETISDLLTEDEKYDESLRDSEWPLDLSLSFQKKRDSRQAELSAVLLEAPFSLHTDDPTRRTIFHAELVDSEWIFTTHGDYQFYTPVDETLPEEDQEWQPILKIESGSGFLPRLIPTAKDDRENHFPKVSKKFEICCLAITQLLDGSSLRYLGPIRYEPRRVYLASDLSSHQWEAKGQSAIKDLLLKDLTEAQREKLDFWFSELGLSESLNSERLRSITINEESSEAMQLNFNEGGPIKSINIKDVGHGAAQVLPVVLQTLFAPKGAFIIVEQPELHLHPEAQATLADLFIESLNESRENGQPPTRIYLIETHSETLFLRLRVELARTAAGVAGKFLLKPEDFICYYVERDRKQGISKAEKIVFDDKAEFVERPEKFFDFFGQDFKETMELRNTRSLIKE